MNVATLIVLAVVLALIVAAVWHIARHGTHSCGACDGCNHGSSPKNCSHCNHAGSPDCPSHNNCSSGGGCCDSGCPSCRTKR